MIKFFVVTLTAVTTLSCMSYAQVAKPEAQPGYVVSSKGDTLFGKVNYLKKTGYRQSMQLELPDDTKKVCSPRNYKYVQAGDEIFEAYAVSTGDVTENAFFWRKSSGKISFYEYQYEMYVANNMVTKSEYYIKKNGSDELIRLNGANFKKKLGEIIKDDPKTLERIEAKDTKLESVEEIIKEYNQGA